MKSLEKHLFANGNSNVTQTQLFTAISKLPEDNQQVISLHFLQQIPRKEIAEQLNWSINKVNQKITRGITLLKNQMNPDYFAKMNEILSS